MKENCANWGLSHVPTVVRKVGVRGNLVYIPGCSQQRLLKKNYRVRNYKKFSPLQKFQFIPKFVHTPEDYKFNTKFINSAEDLTNVLLKNDQT